VNLRITAWLTIVTITLCLIQPLVVVGAPEAASSGQTPIQQMATIMYRLKHFPDPQSKETLQQIVDNPASSPREKDLANAMLRLNHRALVDDKISLKKIMEDESASADERDLASIIYNLDHRPTKGDKKRLEEMMK